MAELFDDDPGSTKESRRAFALRHGIALADVISECDIVGASDSSIRNPVPMDLSPIMDAAPIRAVFTTGGKASQLYGKLQAPLWPNVEHVALPSTSGANARMRLPELVERYSVITERMENPDPLPWYLYIARCSDGTLYTGISNNVAKRIDAHNAGRGAKYTRSRGPIECEYVEELPDRGSALRRESQVKAMTRSEKEALISSASTDRDGKS